MIDTREDILARLLTLAATVPNIQFTDRNNADVVDTELPALIIFDGDEETDDATLPMRIPSSVTLVRMHPIIELVAMSAIAGSDLSALRRGLLKLVLYDTQLNDNIVKTGMNTGRPANGAIRYLGCQTDPTWMRNKKGQMRVQFLFKYKLNPADL